MPIDGGLQPDLTALCQAIKSRDHETKWEAARTLQELGPAIAPATPELMAILKHELASGEEGDTEPVCEVLKTLGWQSIPGFVDLLRDDDPEVRAVAAFCLKELDAPASEVVPALSEAMRRPGEGDKFSIAEALAHYGAEPELAAPVLIERLETIIGSDEDRDLGDYDIGMMCTSLLVDLRHCGPTAAPAIPILMDLLHEPFLMIVKNAARTLGAIGRASEQAVPILESFLKTPFLDFFNQRLPGREHLLDKASERLYRELQVYSAEALWSITGNAETSVSYLLQILKNRSHESENDPDIRAPGLAADALGRIGPVIDEVVPTLIEAWEWSISALGEIGPPASAALPALRAGISSSEHIGTRLEIAWSIYRIEKTTKDVLSVLIEAIGHSSYFYRRWAAKRLGQMGPPAQAAIPALRQLFTDKDLVVRTLAHDAIFAITSS